MAVDYSQYNDLLNFIAQKNSALEGAWSPYYDYANAGTGYQVSPDWLTNPTGVFDQTGANYATPGSYNPYFSPQVRDLVRKAAERNGLTQDDADRAALEVAQATLHSQGGQELYSEATHPAIIADRIAQQMFATAGKPYTPLTPEQQQHLFNVAQDYQTNLKGTRQDVQDASDLQSGLWAASVFAGPILGAVFGGAGAAAGETADAAGAAAGETADVAGNVYGTEAGSDQLLGGAGEDMLPGENPYLNTDAAPNVNPTYPNAADPTYTFPPSPTTPTNADPTYDWPGSSAPPPADVPAAPAPGSSPFPNSVDASLGGGLGTLGTGVTVGLGAGAANNLLNDNSGNDQNSSSEPGSSGGSGSGNTLLDTLLGSGGGSAAGGINLGGLLASILGGAGAYNQTEALKDLAQKYMDMGQPYRDKLLQLYSNPDTYLHSAEVMTPVQMGTDALAKSLSVKGNPFGSGTSLQALQDYATKGLYGQVQNEKDRLANFGGLSKFSSAAPGVATGAIDASGGMYNAAGYGLNSVLNPQSSMQNLMRQYGLS